MVLRFQSTRPQGARRLCRILAVPCSRFNPRARKGRDYHGAGVVTKGWVSIHAPARGATCGLAMLVPVGGFQSTRPQGARRITIRTHSPSTRFNPRARKGRDPPAPSVFGGDSGFNPRARKGRDGSTLHMIANKDAFQSTRPQGARPNELTFEYWRSQFQSTRPQGARQALDWQLHKLRPVSIHAPARGATLLHAFVTEVPVVSIHAPARGAT